MNRNASLARWCGIAGIIGMGLGIVAGVLGLLDPAGVYAPPPASYNYTTQTGQLVAILNGVMVLCFTASFVGFHLIGAVGDGLLGKIATWLSALGNLGSALGFFHAALIGGASPLTVLGFLVLPGWILLSVAALRERRVSTLHALWPLATLIVLTVIEFAVPISGFSAMLHQLVYGSISFVVLSNLGRGPAPTPAPIV